MNGDLLLIRMFLAFLTNCCCPFSLEQGWRGTFYWLADCVCVCVCVMIFFLDERVDVVKDMTRPAMFVPLHRDPDIQVSMELAPHGGWGWQGGWS